MLWLNVQIRTNVEIIVNQPRIRLESNRICPISLTMLSWCSFLLAANSNWRVCQRTSAGLAVDRAIADRATSFGSSLFRVGALCVSFPRMRESSAPRRRFRHFQLRAAGGAAQKTA